MRTGSFPHPHPGRWVYPPARLCSLPVPHILRQPWTQLPLSTGRPVLSRKNKLEHNCISRKCPSAQSMLPLCWGSQAPTLARSSSEPSPVPYNQPWGVPPGEGEHSHVNVTHRQGLSGWTGHLPKVPNEAFSTMFLAIGFHSTQMLCGHQCHGAGGQGMDRMKPRVQRHGPRSPRILPPAGPVVQSCMVTLLLQTPQGPTAEHWGSGCGQ